MADGVVPDDSRYIPFVQQPYCCVPASIQTILYKNKIPLLSQEEIGALLGLIVPPEVKDSFYNVESQDKPVVSSGFGTRIQDPAFSLSNLIKTQKWPFEYNSWYASKISAIQLLARKLAAIEANDIDAIVCFQNDRGTGHVCVFDRLQDTVVRLIDPSPSSPKWRFMSIDELFDRIQNHGDRNGGGLWIFNKL